MAKPDNRADNETHLQEHIDHTIANLRRTEDYLAEHSDEISSEEKLAVEAKNERRKESIENFIDEKRDEASDH